MRRRLLRLLVGSLLALACGLLGLRWALQRQLPARLLQQQLTRALGFPVRFRNYHLSWGGELTLHNLQLLETDGRPFLSVSEAEVDFDRGRALQGRLQVEQIALEQPRLELSARRWEQIRRRPSQGKGHRNFPLLVHDLELAWLRPDGTVAWHTDGWSGQMPPPTEQGWSLLLQSEEGAAVEARPGFLRLERFPLGLLASMTSISVPFKADDRMSGKAVQAADRWQLQANVQADVYRGSLEGTSGSNGWKLHGAAEHARFLGPVSSWRLQSEGDVLTGELQRTAGGGLTLAGRYGAHHLELSGMLERLKLAGLDGLEGQASGILDGRWHLQGSFAAPEFVFAGHLSQGAPLESAPVRISWARARGGLRVGPVAVQRCVWVRKHLPRLRGELRLELEWPERRGSLQLTRLHSGVRSLPPLQAEGRWTGLGLADCQLLWELSPRPLELRGSVGLFSSLTAKLQGQSLADLTFGSLPVTGRLFGDLTLSMSGLHIDGTVAKLSYAGVPLGDARLELRAGSRLSGQLLWKRSLPAQAGQRKGQVGSLLAEPWPRGRRLQGLRLSGSLLHPVCQGVWDS